MYINCHSYYSLRFGTFSEVELLKMAQAYGMDTIALTDINNTSACLNFVRRSADFGIRPILGIDFRNGAEQQFVGLAKNNEGFRELNAFLSHHSHNGIPIPPEAPDFMDAFIIYPFEKVLQMDKVDFRANEFIGISIENLRRLPFSKYKDFTDKLIIQQPVTFRNKRDYNAHRLLRAIANNTLLSKLQQTEQGSMTERMLPLDDLLEMYREFPHIIENTKSLMASCSIRFDFGEGRISQNQQVFGISKEADFE
ncbi:MAG TPA: PHP domain-containing protein, partial [Arenibacter sp.]|nr:PHP domain-containing protein [Arenibacter sp.]